MTDQIRVYGTQWCGDCYRSKKFLDRHAIPYQWIDIAEGPEAQRFVKEVNRGMMSVPIIMFPDGSILVEPSDRQLSEKLRAA